MEAKTRSYRTVVDILATRKALSIAEDSWQDLFKIAEEQRVLPFVANCLSSQGANLPAPMLERLAGIARENRQAAFWFSAELKGLLSAFAAAAIDVIPLKGPSFGERVYGGAQLRAVRDLDVLVRRTQVASAQELLAELGFQLHRKDCDYHETWTRATTVVELHWNVAETALFNFDIDSAWQLAVPGTFSGEPALCLDPMDELLFICLHGARHCFENLGLVLDVALLLDQLGERDELGERGLRPEVQHLGGVLVLGCELAQNLRPGKPLPSAVSQLAREHADIRRMAEAHWRQLSTGCSMQKRWPEVRRFYRWTMTTRRGRIWRRIRDAVDGYHLIIDADNRWAGKVGREYKLLWLVRALRFLSLKSSKSGKREERNTAS